MLDLNGKLKMHKHHIIPKHMGGTDDPSNLILVNIALHAFLHKILWDEYGLVEDFLAWKGLSGQMPFWEIEEEMELIRRKRISKAKKGKTFMSNETREKMSESAKKRATTIKGKEHLIKAAAIAADKSRNIPRTMEIKQKCSIAHKGKPKTEEHKQAMRKPKSIKLGWFTDGTTNLKLRLTDKIPDGFLRGRTFNATR